MPSNLKFSNIDFAYGEKAVVRDFSLNVEAGSFTTLLGPSGCGKTTLLRLAAGFLTPDSGSIEIDGVNQIGIAPNLRNVAFVFQDYALFPHMTVEDNILYGLKLQKKRNRKLPDSQRHVAGSLSEVEGSADALHDVLAMVDLQGFEKRYPHELSGGQQQRAALARSLILKPGILLMDEPLSSLDAKLRTQVREELRELQQKLKITTIYVTHDQEEAFSLSDTIAVMDSGTLLQSGTPRDIYYQPANRFVAEFTGRANIVNGQVIRPEWFSLSQGSQPAASAISGTVQSITFLGAVTRIKLLENASGILTIDLPTTSAPLLTTGETVTVYPVHSWNLQ